MIPLSVLSRNDNVVDKAVFPGFLRRHIIVPFGIDLDLSKIDLGTLAADSDVVSKAWNIKIPASAELGTYPIVIYAGCDGIEE